MNQIRPARLNITLQEEYIVNNMHTRYDIGLECNVTFSTMDQTASFVTTRDLTRNNRIFIDNTPYFLVSWTKVNNTTYEYRYVIDCIFQELVNPTQYMQLSTSNPVAGDIIFPQEQIKTGRVVNPVLRYENNQDFAIFIDTNVGDNKTTNQPYTFHDNTPTPFTAILASGGTNLAIDGLDTIGELFPDPMSLAQYEWTLSGTRMTITPQGTQTLPRPTYNIIENTMDENGIGYCRLESTPVQNTNALYVIRYNDINPSNFSISVVFQHTMWFNFTLVDGQIEVHDLEHMFTTNFESLNGPIIGSISRWSTPKDMPTIGYYPSDSDIQNHLTVTGTAPSDNPNQIIYNLMELGYPVAGVVSYPRGYKIERDNITLAGQSFTYIKSIAPTTAFVKPIDRQIAINGCEVDLYGMQATITPELIRQGNLTTISIDVDMWLYPTEVVYVAKLNNLPPHLSTVFVQSINSGYSYQLDSYLQWKLSNSRQGELFQLELDKSNSDFKRQQLQQGISAGMGIVGDLLSGNYASAGNQILSAGTGMVFGQLQQNANMDYAKNKNALQIEQIKNNPNTNTVGGQMSQLLSSSSDGISLNQLSPHDPFNPQYNTNKIVNRIVSSLWTNTIDKATSTFTVYRTNHLNPQLVNSQLNNVTITVLGEILLNPDLRPVDKRVLGVGLVNERMAQLGLWRQKVFPNIYMKGTMESNRFTYDYPEDNPRPYTMLYDNKTRELLVTDHYEGISYSSFDNENGVYFNFGWLNLVENDEPHDYMIWVDYIDNDSAMMILDLTTGLGFWKRSSSTIMEDMLYTEGILTKPFQIDYDTNIVTFDDGTVIDYSRSINRLYTISF